MSWRLRMLRTSPQEVRFRSSLGALPARCPLKNRNQESIPNYDSKATAYDRYSGCVPRAGAKYQGSAGRFHPPALSGSGSSRLGLSKPPSWIVKSESNVRREKYKKPDQPCVVCDGSGRVDCHNCRGRGRTNCVHLAMLPKGEWPKWCRVCGGSGLGHCSHCLGTGEYRDIMGSHFMANCRDIMKKWRF